MNLYDAIPVLIGGAITWLISWLYYKKAGDKLKQEAVELRRLTNLILRSLGNAGIVELAKAGYGEPTGIRIKGTSQLVGQARMSAKAEVMECKSADRGAEETTDVDSCRNSV
jgi:hypothetical protein